jgi:hypothetical protein
MPCMTGRQLVYHTSICKGHSPELPRQAWKTWRGVAPSTTETGVGGLRVGLNGTTRPPPNKNYTSTRQNDISARNDNNVLQYSIGKNEKFPRRLTLLRIQDPEGGEGRGGYRTSGPPGLGGSPQSRSVGGTVFSHITHPIQNGRNCGWVSGIVLSVTCMTSELSPVPWTMRAATKTVDTRTHC